MTFFHSIVDCSIQTSELRPRQYCLCISILLRGRDWHLDLVSWRYTYFVYFRYFVSIFKAPCYESIDNFELQELQSIALSSESWVSQLWASNKKSLHSYYSKLLNVCVCKYSYDAMSGINDLNDCVSIQNISLTIK